MPNTSKKNKKHLWITIACFIVSFAISTSLNAFRGGLVRADDQSITPDEITISATIGTPTHMTIFGYAPPLSRIILYGNGITAEVEADAKGYFSFNQIYTTGGTRNYPELCLLAYIGGYSTQPTCLPALQGNATVYTIGPVLLSPIISIEQNVFPLGTQVILNGITIPNSEVSIYFEQSGGWFTFVPNTHGYSLPPYKVTSDEFGKFQLNLPSNFTTRWKVYASVNYSSSTSTRSNTLNFRVESNVVYYLTRIYETVVKTTKLATTVITTTSAKNRVTPDGFPNTNISENEIEAFRYRLPYYAIYIELFILLILILLFLLLRKKRRKKDKNHSN